jgi:antitoxin component YwqK of YwqJK toxin-antitoxin module
MKKGLLFGILLLIGGTGLAVLVKFGGKQENLRSWWHKFSHNSDSLPWCPYNSREVDASKIHIKEATQVIFLDQNLFWKGQGATVGPEIDTKGRVVRLIVTSGGTGYSPTTTAKVIGAGSEAFALGSVAVKHGKVTGVELISGGDWYDTPRIHSYEEDGRVEALPYSGTTKLKFDNGQVHETKQFLSGELHGRWKRFRQDGIQVFDKEFTHGEKHGTHIYYFHDPIDPEDYKTQSDAHLKKKIYASLWLEVHEDAKREFSQYPSPEANEWAIKKYKQRGGEFRVRLLEHYENNKKHGSFEGYDYLGNPTFKDDYTEGLRKSHRTFDKTKKG